MEVARQDEEIELIGMESDTATTRETPIKVGEIANLKQPVDNPDNPTIFKVPKHIRELDPKAYDPVVASIGPFQHCPYCWSSVMHVDPKMQTKSQLDGEAYKPVAASCGLFDHHAYPYSTSVMQHYKWRCVWHLLSHPGNDQEHANQLLDECLVKLKEKNDEVRSCYSEQFPPWMDDRKLALIMLLDGCFIIYLMLKQSLKEDAAGKKRIRTIETGEGKVVLHIKEKVKQLEYPTGAGLFTIDLVVYDLLKLENQIPFFIIQLLFDQLKPCEHDLVDLALGLFKGIHPEESKSFKDKEKKSPDKYHHLLHLFYSSRIPPIECIESEEIKEEATTAPRWIPSATELDRAGVKFKKNKLPDSFLNITFKWRKMKIMPWLRQLCLTSGRMEIPPLQIEDHTGSLFQNLIAFEQCYRDTKMYITIYAIFMDCIIDQAEDVRLLYLEGILEHGLGNDQAVADLFNKLGNQIFFTWKKNYLKSQIKKINEFYGFKWHKWLAGLRRDYLSNPWAIISVLAAMFLLLLTMVQAVFSVSSYVVHHS